jgi:ABC-type bacteriocin/lantibiotic exporter with double-glycine peptidase domain
MDRIKKIASRYFRIFEFLPVLHVDAGRAGMMWVLKIVGLFASMALPLLTKSLIDTAIGQRNWHAFTLNAVVSLGIVFSSFAATAAATWYSTRIAESFGFRLRLMLQKRLERMGVLQLRRWDVGDQICLANSDVGNVTHVLVEVLPGSTILLVEFLVFAVIAFSLDVRLTVYFGLSFPFIILLEALHARTIRPLQHKLQHLSGRVNELVSEYTTGMLTFKAFAVERRQTRAYAHTLAQHVRQVLHKWKIDSAYQAAQWLIQAGWGWAVVFYGFSLVMRGELSLGTLLALKMYFTALSRPLEEATTISQAFVVGSVSAERLSDVLKSPVDEETRESSQLRLSAANAQPGDSEFILENVSFGYHANQQILRNISLNLPARGLIGITGPSGAGKTTLLGLIARLFRPREGNIYAGNIDLSELRHREVALLVSVVLQETFLFHGTIYDNIACTQPDITEADVMRAARMAAAHDFILHLHDGYHTDARSAGLSIGQKQRIGIARALATRARILVLDEPTSALDVGIGKLVLESLRQTSKERLVILISHDPDTLARCNDVFVISRGEIEHLDADVQNSFPQFIEYLVLKSFYETSHDPASIPVEATCEAD